MRRWHSRWSEVLTPLGEAGWQLARAEYRALSSEVRNAGRKLLAALLLLMAALFALFWAIGALALVVFEAASLWLPRWGSSLVVLGLFLLTGAVVALVARRKLRSIEPPAETVKRRMSEHREWWERRIASPRRRSQVRNSDGAEPGVDGTRLP